MAYCVNCGNELSAQAVMCPKCGHPGPASPATKAMIGAGGSELAGWGSRVGAAILDLLILAIPFAILAGIAFAAIEVNWSAVAEDSDPFGSGAITSDQVGAIVGLGIAGGLLFVLVMLYKPLMEGSGGQTLGKKMVGVRVVRADGQGRITMGTAFLRAFVAALLGFVGFLNLLNLLWPLWDDLNQTLHDKAAKTIVVRT